MIERGYIWRAILVAVTVMTVWVGLGIRLAFLHLGPNEAIRAKITNIRHVEEEILVGRGRVLDAKGNIIALDRTMKNVCVDPQVITEAGHTRTISRHLARLLHLDPSFVMSKLNRPGRRFEYVKKFVDEETTREIDLYQFDGVFYEDTSVRYYPQGQLMSHVVGFANMNGVGSAGVEQRMNKYLKGRPGLRVSQKDGRRRELYTRRSLEILPQEGADIYLTVDQNLQYMVEKALDAAMEKHHSKGAWAIVQRVRTGEILAMASRPTYDLNQYRYTPQDLMKNRAVSYVYEPGSTFKVAVIAAALNEGVTSPERVIDCENGTWHYRGRPLRDYHAYDRLTVADVLKKSSNIGSAKIALQLGNERLESYLREFGVGGELGVDLPGEEAGILHPSRRWSAISITRIAMGHEVAVTALQMLSIMSAIANDGYLLKPYVVDRVVDANGRTVQKSQPEVIARPIRKDTALVMRKLLTRVTEEGGTATRARVEGYSVAGKTGTAQKPVAGGYSDSANMASFAGFLPAEDPELSIIVVVDEPQPLHTGGSVAAPVFAEIAEQAVRYLDVPPVGAYLAKWKDEEVLPARL